MFSTPSAHNLKIFLILLLSTFYVLLSNLAVAQVPPLSKVRVTYRPDGGVSVTAFVAGACQDGETETQCMDREMQKNPSLANLPHDDIDPSQLPQDRKDRDKWTGSKGRGISIDRSKVTKNEKMTELQDKLDQELDKNNPNSVKIAKLQRKIEKLKDFRTSSNLIPPEKLADFDTDQSNRSLLASVVETVGSAISSVFDGLLTSIQNGFLALKQLVTDTLKVGTPEKPAGITVYDQTTKLPYCLVVKDGKIQSVPGECDGNPISPIGQISPISPIGGNTASTTATTTSLPDTESPVIILNGAASIEIAKGISWVDPGATVTNPSTGSAGSPQAGSGQANNNLGIHYTVDGVLTGAEGNQLPHEVIDTSITGSHTIIYTATDQAGNIGTATRTLNVINPASPTATPTL